MIDALLLPFPNTKAVAPSFTSKSAAAAVDAAIAAIGEVTEASGAAIAGARAAYDALSDSQKGYVAKYQQLLDSEAAFGAIMAAMAPPQ